MPWWRPKDSSVTQKRKRLSCESAPTEAREIATLKGQKLPPDVSLKETTVTTDDISVSQQRARHENLNCCQEVFLEFDKDTRPWQCTPLRSS